jgi:hypothetical protein
MANYLPDALAADTHLQDALNLAWAGLKAAHILHQAGIAHTDFHRSNFVWHDPEHAMALDPELCRRWGVT